MPPLRHLLVVVATSLLAAACARQEAPSASSEGPAPGPAAAGPPPADGAAPAAANVAGTTPPRQRFLGSWTMALTPAQERQYRLLELAFRDPVPTAEELAALHLDQSEQLMLSAALAGRAQNPDDASLAEVRSGLEELSSATLEITADTLVFSFGEEREEAVYTVSAEQDGELRLQTVTQHEGGAVTENVTVTFEGEDRLTLVAEGDPDASQQVFVRRKPAAATP